MFKETKDTLFEDLMTIIRIMNGEKFYMNVKGDRDRSKIRDRAGSHQVKEILKRNQITTLYELKKPQLQKEITRIHKSVITANLNCST